VCADCPDCVAFIVGTSQVGLYSPDGNCQYSLAPLPPSPIGIGFLTMALMSKQILACGGTNNTNCFLYNVARDQWSIYSAGHFVHNERRGVVHQGKIYLPDDTNPEVFDPVTQTWSIWPAPLFSVHWTCFVSWKNVILGFGGDSNKLRVSKFDPTTNAWSTLSPSSPPMELDHSSCAVLSDMNVLLAGSSSLAWNYKKFAVYNVTSNTWPLTTNATVNLYHSSLLILGNRFFTIPHYAYSTVTEYIYISNTASSMKTLFNLSRPFFAGSISAPASWFAHLPNDCTVLVFNKQSDI
jgi:hypothetical protein